MNILPGNKGKAERTIYVSSVAFRVTRRLRFPGVVVFHWITDEYISSCDIHDLLPNVTDYIDAITHGCRQLNCIKQKYFKVVKSSKCTIAHSCTGYFKFKEDENIIYIIILKVSRTKSLLAFWSITESINEEVWIKISCTYYDGAGSHIHKK